MSRTSRSPSAPGLQAGAGVLVAVGLAYYGANSIALLFPDSAHILTAIWPAGGIGLAALLLTPRAGWGAMLALMFVAGNAANLSAGRPLAESLGFMTANALESYLGAWVIVRTCGREVRFHRRREVAALLAAAGGVNAFTALLGAGTAGAIAGAAFWPAYRTWWVADALGILVVAPLIVTWIRPEPSARGRAGWWLLELAVVLAAALTFAAFYFGSSWRRSPLLLHSYMLIVPLAWAAIRLGPRGVSTIVACLAVVVLGATASGYGTHPLGGQSPTEHIQWVQLFLGITCGIAYLLAASHAQHEEAEAFLREAEAGLRALGDNLPDGVVYQFVATEDGSVRFAHVSAGLERVLGLSPEAVLADARRFHDRIVEEDRLRVLEGRAESLRTMGVFNLTVRMRRGDGALRRVRLSSAPRRLPDGAVMWDGILTDITEQEEAQQAVRDSEARYRQLVEYAPIGITLIADGVVVYMNREAARIVGAPDLAAARGRPVWEFLPGEIHATIRERLQTIIATGQPSPPLEIRLRRMDGTLIDVETRGVPVQHEGRFAVQNMLVDISERKRSETALRRGESQLRALTSRVQTLREEERTRLAREIHDHLGQLLTALGLDLRSIERRLPAISDPEVRGALATKAASARELVDETIASVQKIASELRPPALDRLGLEVAIEFEAEAFAARTGVRFDLNLNAAGMEISNEMATALFRILQEILTNVARHAHASTVRVELRREGDEVVLVVADDGTGIRDEDIDNTRSLGLLGMRERAQILGGIIVFRRRDEGGTIVTVRLPLVVTATVLT